jgi:hypothetical protein
MRDWTQSTCSKGKPREAALHVNLHVSTTASVDPLVDAVALSQPLLVPVMALTQNI